MGFKKNIFIVAAAAVAGAFGNGCDGNTYKQGAILYTNFCANCHMETGEGLRGLIPPLAKSDYLAAHRADLACLIRNGQRGKIVVNGVEYNQQEMLGIKKLSDLEYRDAITIEGNVLLNEAHVLFKKSNVDTIVVTDGGKPVGMLDIQDIQA